METTINEAMPQAIEAEYGLLGLILWNERLFPEVEALISGRDFYKDMNRTIYDAIRTVAKRGDVTDPITVADILEHRGIPEIMETPVSSFLFELQHHEQELINLQPPDHRAASYAKLIKQAAEKRRLIGVAGKINAIAMNGATTPIADALNLVQALEQDAKQEEDPRLTIGAKGKRILKISSMTDVEGWPEPRYLVPNLLQVASVSLLYGESGAGKTFVALAFALCLAYGLPWLGRNVRQGKVLYIYAEGRLGLKKRLWAWLSHYNLEPTPNLHFIAVPVDLINDRQYILDTIAEQEIAYNLVVIDTFSNCSPGVDQNNQEEVYRVLAVAHEITRDYNAHVLVVHHTNKSGVYSGTAAFKRHVDTMIEAVKVGTDGLLVLRCEKQRDDEPFSDISAQLLKVDLGSDDNLEPISSCILAGSLAMADGQALPLIQQKMLDILGLHGRLFYNEWKKACEDAQAVRSSAFATNVKLLHEKKLIRRSDGSNGQKIWYEVTELVQPVRTSPTDCMD